MLKEEDQTMRMIQVSEGLYECLTNLARQTYQSPDRLAEGMLQSLIAPAEQLMSATMARRKVNHFVASEFSVLAGAGESVLSQAGGRTVWQVPVILTQPGRGTLGQIGVILVDRTTGSLLLTETVMEEMRARARSLVAGSALQTRTSP